MDPGNDRQRKSSLMERDQRNAWKGDEDALDVLIPQTIRRSAIFGTYTGVAGLVVGSVAGILRSSHPVIFASASGIQCFGLGAIYWASRETLQQAFRQEQYAASASGAAGAISGVAMAALTRGRANVLPAALFWGTAGFTGQFAIDRYQRRAGEEVEAPQASIWDSKWSPIKRITDDDYEIMLKERLLRIDARLAVVDEDLRKFQQQSSPSQPKPT